MAFETGKMQTVVGTGEGGDAGDSGPATEAGLEHPHGCGIDSQGNLYIADGINHLVRAVGMGSRGQAITGDSQSWVPRAGCRL